MDKLTIRSFFKKFPDDDTCLDHVMDVRYGRHRSCPKCERKAHFYRLKKRPAYSCEFCGHHIYPCAGTPFERTRTPLQMWFYAMYLFTTTRHGVPAKELQRQLGVTYKCAWRIGHEIRKHMDKVDGDSGLSGHVELDETFVGGRPRNKQFITMDNPHRTGRPGPDSKKTVVFGMVERGGDIITRVVKNARSRTLLPHVHKYVEKGTVMSTDQWAAYRPLKKMGYAHKTVNHSINQWVDGETHTNTIEGFWSHFKNSVLGTHRSISRKHMQKYLCEFEFRFNARNDVSGAMFERLIRQF